MRITIDTEQKTVALEDGQTRRMMPLYSRESFECLTREWLRVGWNEKYTYTFTWLGRPMIQLPEDMLRLQEVLFRIQPDVIIETGIAHGGSLVFYASLCKVWGRGRIVGVDVEIRKHNRAAIEAHPLASYITLIEGDSTAPATVDRVKGLIKPGQRVFVVLDSCHTKQHVLAELNAYHTFVSPGSYIVATDGLMQDLGDVPRGQPHWADDNPAAAVTEFAAAHPEFVVEQPEWLFNESQLRQSVTHWPNAWLRRTG